MHKILKIIIVSSPRPFVCGVDLDLHMEQHCNLRN